LDLPSFVTLPDRSKLVTIEGFIIPYSSETDFNLSFLTSFKDWTTFIKAFVIIEGFA